MNSSSRKCSGGAQREREKNKILLLDSSKKCKKINSFFFKWRKWSRNGRNSYP